jgi:hypothetical protein
MNAEQEATIREQERIAKEGSRLLDVVLLPTSAVLICQARAQFYSPRCRLISTNSRNSPNSSGILEICDITTTQSIALGATNSGISHSSHKYHR